jgi:hypothetical protein
MRHVGSLGSIPLPGDHHFGRLLSCFVCRPNINGRLEFVSGLYGTLRDYRAVAEEQL